jgi:hypothetical protein
MESTCNLRIENTEIPTLKKRLKVRTALKLGTSFHQMIPFKWIKKKKRKRKSQCGKTMFSINIIPQWTCIKNKVSEHKHKQNSISQ